MLDEPMVRTKTFFAFTLIDSFIPEFVTVITAYQQAGF